MLNQDRAIFQSFISGGSKEDGEAHEEGEFSGHRPFEAREHAAEYRDHRAGRAGPESEALHATDEGGLFVTEFVEGNRWLNVGVITFYEEAFEDDHDDAADDHSDEHRSGELKMFFDEVLEEKADGQSRKASDANVDKEFQAIGVFAEDAGDDFQNGFLIEKEHSEDGAGLNDDFIGLNGGDLFCCTG